CVRLQGDRGKLEKYLRRFSTMTADLRALAAWLIELRVTHVAMESTGVYWKPVWNILEGNFTSFWPTPNMSKMCRAARLIMTGAVCGSVERTRGCSARRCEWWSASNGGSEDPPACVGAVGSRPSRFMRRASSAFLRLGCASRATRQAH